MAKNIEINYQTGNGYEVLYPKTIPELTGCLPLTGGALLGPFTSRLRDDLLSYRLWYVLINP